MSDNKELRDRLAVLCGHEYCDGSWWKVDGLQRTRLDHHPFPDGDLTALAAVWPEGWWCSVDYRPIGRGLHGMPWCANGGISESEWEYDATTEYDARLPLTVAVLEAKA